MLRVTATPGDGGRALGSPNWGSGEIVIDDSLRDTTKNDGTRIIVREYGIVCMSFRSPYEYSDYGYMIHEDGSPTLCDSAAYGSEVTFCVECPFGLGVGSFSIVAENGEDIPCETRLVSDRPRETFAVFTMPAASVTVTPTAIPTNYPSIHEGENVLSAEIYSFVAPTNGAYAFTDGSLDWLDAEVYDDVDYVGNPHDDGDLELLGARPTT